jgi:hypothetical protein
MARVFAKQTAEQTDTILATFAASNYLKCLRSRLESLKGSSQIIGVY